MLVKLRMKETIHQAIEEEEKRAAATEAEGDRECVSLGYSLELAPARLHQIQSRFLSIE